MFIDLPHDIIFGILAVLEPKEILTLRQSCSQLDKITRDKAVWICALRRRCREYNVLNGSFCVQEMTQTELERAASCPDRFLAFLGDCIEECPQPVESRFLPLPVSLEEATRLEAPEYNGYTGVLMSIGGRFLFTNYKRLLVSLWDLESISPESAPVASLAAKDMGLKLGDRLRIQDSYALQTGKGAYLEVKVMYSAGAREIWMYKIDPLSSHPLFELVGVRSSHDAYQSTLWNNLLIFTQENGITIWNLETDSSVMCWSGFTVTKTIHVYEDHLIILDIPFNKFMVLKMPWELNTVSFTGAMTLPVVQGFSPLEGIPNEIVRPFNVSISRDGIPIYSVISTIGRERKLIFYSLDPRPPQIPERRPSSSAFGRRHLSTSRIDYNVFPNPTFYRSGSTCILPLARYLLTTAGPPPMVDLLVVKHSSSVPCSSEYPARPLGQRSLRFCSPGQPVISFDLCPFTGKTAVVSEGRVEISCYLP